MHLFLKITNSIKINMRVLRLFFVLVFSFLSMGNTGTGRTYILIDF